MEWYKRQLDYLQEKYGVDGFKFDGGDAYFFDEDDASFIKGCEQDQIACYEELGKLYPFHEFRCGWKGGGKPYVHRLQDKMHTWEGEGLNQIIPHSLLQGLTGNFYHCPDMLGGGVFNDLFETSFDEELFIRWTQASALCPMIQFSLGAMESIKPGRLSDCGEDVSAASGNGALHSGAGREGGLLPGSR